ncbi:phosphoglycerol transferase I [bacteria symbiont BFo1 of Frankliniella occidentalis]|jgi:phosphoglycerol transferase|uniref:phosphatidylglycerol--membrane-oligosaccharide glycerophosphotransferase n=1 Tax=Erwinia TaxID=551 RepID=UPI000664775F|nr:phosphatidylglycerol--membrane-oligosaccharide glycerophosphotransferase [Erwinia sp. V90_4]KMV72660.1 phosphoglycerol transferase I [bacteria symbiont BFo1 of Frankliniella occidentalis]PIJ56187.1 phosphoglycerol transferase I [Erwinia sp. OLMDLW33]KYP86741.1 phosphoglycerol transferase I [bacteria symbiont BFo1 of Frankliniella occidentalis]KYP92084.1 phosphoglycerol transferase I [bacteria symbiont BFo1 of Frankliniella occidentalis]MDI3441840.1 phosphatidylglycerol--membrane-oligosaccha
MVSEWLSLLFFIASVSLYTWKAGRHKLWFSAVLVLLGVYIVLNASLLASNYFTGEGINDAVIYTITSSLSGAGVQKYILPAVGLIITLLLLFLLLSWVLRLRKNHNYSKLYSLLALVLAVLSIKTTPAYQQVTNLIKSQMTKGDSDFYSHYQVPGKSLRGDRPNLVYIYAESLERTYFDEHAFPKLAPELNEIKNNSLDFSNTEQLPGTEYTIAGMVASQCGIPLFAPFDGNASSSLSTFYPQNVCLGDILKSSGYQNYFYQGASLSFAGKDLFLSSHGFDHMYGFKELAGVVKDPKYRNDWGWYDDTVLEVVFDKYLELAQKNQPFSLFALTVDTHHPDGFISRSCQRKSYPFDGKENKSFAAVACGQEHIARLIEKIRATPYFKNTIIVVSSDHLAMNNTAYKYLNQHDRRDLFFMLRGDDVSSKVISLKRNTLDNGATVLDAMGGDNFIGLGRSSLSSTSLSATYLNIKEKINEWKPDVISLWNFPKAISDYKIDSEKNTFSFSGAHFKLPLLLSVMPNKIEPKLDAYLATPLKQQLARFAPDEKFVWIDRCYKIGSVWDDKLIMNNGLCVANGTLNAHPTIIQVKPGNTLGKITFSKGEQSDDRYQRSLTRLKIADADLKYASDSIQFNLPGLPQQVQKVSGLSYAENWGRWSDANLLPDVTIQYLEPLPAKFALTMSARAFGNNSLRPVQVRVGDWQQQVTFGAQDTTMTLQVDNPSRARSIVITPPEPIETSEGTVDGFAARKLGIGLVSLKVTAQP